MNRPADPMSRRQPGPPPAEPEPAEPTEPAAPEEPVMPNEPRVLPGPDPERRRQVAPSEPAPVPAPATPSRRWQTWGNLAAGIWLFISPWVLGYAYGAYSGYDTYAATNGVAPRPGAPWNFWLVGTFVLLIALWSLSFPLMRWPGWINAGFAIWLFVSPWVLGYSDVGRAAWNAWIVAVIVFSLAIWGSLLARDAAQRMGSDRLVGFLRWRPRRPVNP